jgi:hypothetical protein
MTISKKTEAVVFISPKTGFLYQVLKETKTDVENRGAQTVWDLEKRLGTKDHQSGEETKKDGVFCHFSLLLADSFGGIIAHQFLLQQGQIR